MEANYVISDSVSKLIVKTLYSIYAFLGLWRVRDDYLALLGLSDDNLSGL